MNNYSALFVSPLIDEQSISRRFLGHSSGKGGGMIKNFQQAKGEL